VSAVIGEVDRVHEEAEELSDAIRQLRRGGGSPWPATVTGAQVDLLRVIRRLPGISVGEAAHELGVAPNTVSTLVGQLTGAGLVERRIDGSDRRVAHLELTASARRQVDEARTRRASSLAAALVALGAEDRRRVREVVAVLARLTGELTAVGPPSP
jgi:DNA-binding MarR family transcriptional regulator